MFIVPMWIVEFKRDMQYVSASVNRLKKYKSTGFLADKVRIVVPKLKAKTWNFSKKNCQNFAFKIKAYN